MTNDEPSKLGGKMEELKGHVREHTTGIFNDQEKAKGLGEQATGQAEHDVAETKGWIQGATDSVVGNVKNVAGKALGNKQMEAEGYAQAKGGDAKKAANE